MTVNEARAALVAVGGDALDLKISHCTTQHWSAGHDEPQVSESWTVVGKVGKTVNLETADRLDQAVARIVDRQPK